MSLDQLDLPPAEFDATRLCDSCTNEFVDGERLVVYLSDTVWSQGERVDLPRLFSHEMYCLDCYPDEIPIPHLGTNEGIVIATMQHDREEDYSYERHQLIQGSSASEGVDWNPKTLLEEFHTTPVRIVGYDITPFYVFILFRRSGVDLRGFVTGNSLEIPHEEQEKVMEIIRITVDNVSELGYRPERL